MGWSIGALTADGGRIFASRGIGARKVCSSWRPFPRASVPVGLSILADWSAQRKRLRDKVLDVLARESALPGKDLLGTRT